MTTCAECLSALSTARVADIHPQSAIALHCYSCPECNRTAEEISYAEYRLAAGLSEASSSRTASEVGGMALFESERLRRRRIARFIRGGLAVGAAGVFAALIALRVETPPTAGGELLTETIPLRCISARHATELVTPYLRSDGTAVYRSDDLRTITIRGRPAELAGAKSVIDWIDRTGACKTRATTPPASSGGTPDKD